MIVLNGKADSFSIYALDISVMSEQQYKKAVEFVESDRRKKAENLYKYEDKKRCIGAGLLMRWLIEHIMNADEKNAKVKYEKFGKPFIEGSSLHFNISHSGKWVVCVVSGVPVGIDIEEIQNIESEVLKYCMTEQEIVFLMTMSRDLRNYNFIRLWTLKESYVKMTGTGLFDGMNKIGIKKAAHYYYLTENSSLNEKVLMLSTEFDDKYHISVCFDSVPDKSFSGCNMNITQLKLDEICH
jgi:4'-phosphopantetheinyl transferase